MSYSPSLAEPDAVAIYDALESIARRAAWEHTNCWDTALAVGRYLRRSARVELEPYLAEETNRRFTTQLHQSGHVCVPRQDLAAAMDAITRLHRGPTATTQPEAAA